METKTKNGVANTGAAVTTSATAPGAVVIAGGGMSASAITSGLALLGGGSMLVGIGVIAVGSVGVFYGSRWLYRKFLKA